MALLLLNSLAMEAGNRRLIAQLGVMDLLLTQLLLAPEEAQLSVAVANLTLVDDEVKQTLCADEDLQIFETLIFALRSLCSRHTTNAARVPQPLLEVAAGAIGMVSGVTGIKELTITSSDLRVAYLHDPAPPAETTPHSPPIDTLVSSPSEKNQGQRSFSSEFVETIDWTITNSQNQISASLLLAYFDDDFCENEWCKVPGAELLHPEGVSSIVAALRNLTRISSSSNFTGFSAEFKQLIEDSGLIATLSVLIYPNNKSLTATGANMRLRRYAEVSWGVSSYADYALDLLINLASDADLRARMRKAKVHAMAYKIFRTCMPEASCFQSGSWKCIAPSNLILAGTKAKILSCLLCQTKVTYNFGLNLHYITSQKQRSSEIYSLASYNLVMTAPTVELLGALLYKLVNRTYPVLTLHGGIEPSEWQPHDTTINSVVKCIRTLMARNHSHFAAPENLGLDLIASLIKIIAQKTIFRKKTKMRMKGGMGYISSPSVSDTLLRDALYCLYAMSIDGITRATFPDQVRIAKVRRSKFCTFCTINTVTNHPRRSY